MPGDVIKPPEANNQASDIMAQFFEASAGKEKNEKSPDVKLQDTVDKMKNKYGREVANAKTDDDAKGLVDKAVTELNQELAKDPKLAQAIADGSQKEYPTVFLWRNEKWTRSISYDITINNKDGKLTATSSARSADARTGEAP